jgi:cellulose synthase/poly-beta-1,6-N-acetylglucosamine synthase-like glycosyltransferase
MDRLTSIQVLILAYFIFINGTYTLFNIIAFFEAHRQMRRSLIEDPDFLYKSKLAPSISMIVPAYNEHRIIAESVESLLTCRYPKLMVIVINDGSDDDTLKVLIDKFKLKKVYRLIHEDIKTARVRGYYTSDAASNLYVLDKERGGKADALNAGINVTRSEYFFSIDADVIMEEDAILKIVRPILERPDEVIAAGGILRIANGCDIRRARVVHPGLDRYALPVLQVLEYSRALNMTRTALSALHSVVLLSGAFGVFRTDIAREVGGYSKGTVGEDMEILVRMHKYLRRKKRKYRVQFMTYPIAWTEAPSDFSNLARQRSRWQRGLAETLWQHKSMLFNPRYGHIGLFAMPFFLVVELIGPFVELFGYGYLIFLALTRYLEVEFLILFAILAILWGILLTFWSILLENVYFVRYIKWRDLLRLLIYGFFENLGYRQLTVLWRIRGFFSFIFRKTEWGRMERQGFKVRADAEV